MPIEEASFVDLVLLLTWALASFLSLKRTRYLARASNCRLNDYRGRSRPRCVSSAKRTAMHAGQRDRKQRGSLRGGSR